MPIKIYYFSGTGNSLYISKKLASSLTGCQLQPIAKFYKEKEVDIKDEVIGIVTPLYFSGLPKIVIDFIKKSNFKKADYIFGIVNCGIPFTSSALNMMNKLLNEKGKKLNAGFCLKMVDNYILNFEMPSSPEGQKPFEESCENEIKKISQTITNSFLRKQSEIKLLNVLFSKPFLKKVNQMDNSFYYTSSCNSCKTCEKVCPVNNIKMVNDKPKWNNDCQLCLACIHFCPKEAIQFKNKTEKRKYRYHNRNINIKEIISQKS